MMPAGRPRHQNQLTSPPRPHLLIWAANEFVCPHAQADLWDSRPSPTRFVHSPTLHTFPNSPTHTYAHCTHTCAYRKAAK